MTELPSSVQLEQWETKPAGNWITGALQANNSDYSEGETVPFRLVIPARIDPGQYTFSICRNYEDGERRGYLYLAPFDTSRAATPGGTVDSTLGNFAGVNATIDAVNETETRGACNAGDRETIVTITKGTGDAYVSWGGHLASPLDAGVGTGNGAASWPGASLHMKLLKPSKDVAIHTCTDAATSTPPSTSIAPSTETAVVTASPTHTPTAPSTEVPSPIASATDRATGVPETFTPAPTDTSIATPSQTAVSTNTPASSTSPGVTNTSTPVPTTTSAPVATNTLAPGGAVVGAVRLPGTGTCAGLPATGMADESGEAMPWLLILLGIGIVAVFAGGGVMVARRGRG